MKSLLLKKKNITLKLLEVKDYSKKYLDWLDDKKVNKYLETRFRSNKKSDIIKFIKLNKQSKENYLFGIFVDKVSINNHIGNIKIGPINFNHNYAYVSYFIGEKNYWGKGYASIAVNIVTSYAFNKLKLNKCLAGVYCSNKGSIKVLNKNGYKNEGILKKQLLSGKKYEDEYIFSCFKKNFKEL